MDYRKYKKEIEQAMLDDDLSHPFLGHYRDAAFVGVNTILRLKKDDLKLFFDRRNHKKPDNDGEVRLSLNILQDCGYAQGLCELLSTNIEEGQKGIVGDTLDIDRRQRKNLWQKRDPASNIVSTFAELLYRNFQDENVIYLIWAATANVIVSLFCSSLGKSNWHFFESLTIYFGLLFSCMISAGCDWKKEQQFLQVHDEVNNNEVTVYRGSSCKTVHIRDLVVGDLIQINQGDRVPADCLLIEEHFMFVDETLYDKNRYDVEKETSVKYRKGSFQQKFKPDNHHLNVDPFLFCDSKVRVGQGKAIVLCVGQNTLLSKLRGPAQLKHQEQNTALEQRLEFIAKQIRYYALGTTLLSIVTAIIFLLFSIYFDPQLDLASHDFILRILKIAINAVILLIVSIPEGLPLVISIAMANSISNFKEDNILIQNLESIETCAFIHDLCVSKTGTLTKGVLEVKKLVIHGHDELVCAVEDIIHCEVRELFIESIIQNTDVIIEINDQAEYYPKGSAIETGLVKYLFDNGVDVNARLNKRNKFAKTLAGIPFDIELKRNIVIRQIPGKAYTARVFMKGAPETVIPLCSKTLDFKNNARYIKHQMVLDTDVMNMAKDGLKVLTFAYKDIKMRDLEEVLQKEGGEENEEFRAFIEKDMVYLLTIGFEDPLCEEATQTLQEIDENIKVRILSGDHIETAKSLAKRIGLINNSEDKNDDDLAVMDSKRFREEIGEYTMVWDSQALQFKISIKDQSKFDRVSSQNMVLARASSLDKLIMIQGIKNSGRLIGMTGDSFSDADALRQADIGFCMGRGCDVAKDQSDLIITDSKFKSIHKSMLWGLALFSNVRNYIQFQLTVNVSVVTITILSGMTLGQTPLNVVQMLWINLIMDVLAAISLGAEKPSKSTSNDRISRNDNLLKPGMYRAIICMSLYQILVMVILMYFGGMMFFNDSVNLITLPIRDPTSQEPTNRMKLNTILFNTFILMNLFNQINCKAAKLEISKLFSNKIFWTILMGELGLQSLLLIFGATDLGQAVLGITQITFWQHIICVLLGLSVIPINLGIQIIDEEKFDFALTLYLEEESSDSPISKITDKYSKLKSYITGSSEQKNDLEDLNKSQRYQETFHTCEEHPSQQVETFEITEQQTLEDIIPILSQSRGQLKFSDAHLQEYTQENFERDQEKFFRNQALENQETEQNTLKAMLNETFLGSMEVDLDDESIVYEVEEGQNKNEKINFVEQLIKDKETEFIERSILDQTFDESSCQINQYGPFKKYQQGNQTHLDQILVEEVLEKEKTTKLHHFMINKIYDQYNKAMCLQILKIEGKEAKIVKEIRIQSTLHLCGMASLKINPEYISYVQNGSKLYYWMQKIAENKKVVQLMELDLLSKDLIETAVEECCKEIETNPTLEKEYRGTLVSTMFIPKHQDHINLSKPQDFTEFYEDQLVLFLFKSNKSRQIAQYSGDSFQIWKLSQMKKDSKPLYDSVEQDVVFAQEIQSMGPIFLRIPAKEKFRFQENEFEEKDEIIFLSFIEPDDEDDVDGFLQESFQLKKATINQNPGRDRYCVLKKKTDKRTKIIDIQDDEDFKKSKEEQLADTEKVINTLDAWSQQLQSLGNPRSTKIIDRKLNGDRICILNFCQVNDILQNDVNDKNQISVLLDTSRKQINIINMTGDGGFKHQQFVMQLDDHQKTKTQSQLGGLNRMMFEMNLRESQRVHFNVDTKFNNVIFSHNDMESQMTVGKFTKREVVQSCGHSVENIDVELTRKWNKDFLGIDQMTCRLMAHKSKEIFDKTGMKAQMNNLTFLQHSIEMRVHDDNKDKSFIFRMQERGTSDPSGFKIIQKKLVQRDQTYLRDNPLLIIPERVTFVKDDRVFRPFILIQTEANDYRLISKVTKIWIAIINIDTCDVEHVNEQRILGEVKVNYKNVQKYIKLVQSSDIGQRTDRFGSQCLEQQYQIMIKYDNLDYSMIKQIQVRWHFNDDGSRVRHAYSRIIGQKFLASSGFHEIQNCDLFPLFGENNEILGTQLFEGKGDESHAIQIRNIKQKNTRYPSQVQNYSHYRKFLLHDGCEIIVLEVGLSDLIRGHLWSRNIPGLENSFFTEYDINEILDNSMRTIMNLVPIDFVGLISRDNIQNTSFLGYSLECPLEILEGQTILSKTIQHPQILKELLNSKDLSYEKQIFTKTLIERFIVRDSQREFLEENDLLYSRQEPELATGIDNMPLLRKILNNKDQTQIQLITENLFEDGIGNLSKYEFIMSSLQEAEDSNCFEYFFPFFDCSLDVDNKESNDKTGLLNFDQHMSNPVFKKFINQKRLVVPFVNLDGDFAHDTIVDQVMIEQEKMDKDEEENEVEISFIDFRPLLLQNKFQALIAKNSVHDEMKICMNHLEIARFIDSIYDEEKNYPVDEIDNHKILRTLISYQFNEYSKPYFLALRVMFIFGYFFPLIAQIGIHGLPISLTIITTAMFMMTHVVLFYIEMIQMNTLGRKKYFSQTMNILECIMFAASIYYSLRKLYDPDNKFFANHREVTINPYTVETHILICGAFLIFMSMIKLLKLLQSYDEFGNFVIMTIIAIKKTMVFCMFLGLWIFIFSILFMSIGGRFDDGDYPGMTVQQRTYIQIYRNSIGDIAAPQYRVWFDEDNGFRRGIKGQIMVYTIWIVWFLNQFFCMIMLMNFLVAIIMDEYIQITSYSNHFMYTRRKELNYEALIVYNYFGWLKEFNTLIIWSNPENDGLGQRDVASIVKQFIGQTTDQFYIEVRSKLHDIKVELLKSFDKIHNSISVTSKDKNSQVEEETLLDEFTKNLKSNILKGAQLQQARIEDAQDEKLTQSSIQQIQEKLQHYFIERKNDETIFESVQNQVIDDKNQEEIDKMKQHVCDIYDSEICQINEVKEQISLKIEARKKATQAQKDRLVMVKSKVEANDETLKQIKDSMKEQNTKIQGAKDEFTQMRQDVKELKEKLEKQREEQVGEIKKHIQSTLEEKLKEMMSQVVEMAKD